MLWAVLALAVLALAASALAAWGDAPDVPAAPWSEPTAAPTADLAAAAARTSRVGAAAAPWGRTPTPRPRGVSIGTPQPTPTPVPIRVTGRGWSQSSIALPVGAYRCTATVSDNLYVNLRGQLAPGVALFQIYPDGKVVTLIDGVRGENISRYQVFRVRGGLYPIGPSVEDLASWDLACSLLAP